MSNINENKNQFENKRSKLNPGNTTTSASPIEEPSNTKARNRKSNLIKSNHSILLPEYLSTSSSESDNKPGILYKIISYKKKRKEVTYIVKPGILPSKNRKHRRVGELITEGNRTKELSGSVQIEQLNMKSKNNEKHKEK